MHATRHVGLLTELKAVQICVAQHEPEAEKLISKCLPVKRIGLVTNSPPSIGAVMEAKPSSRQVWRRSWHESCV